MSFQTAEALANTSNVYTWEPPDRVIAARYGLDAADILRFDLNTSPLAPVFLAEALSGPWEPPLNEYPDSTYADLTEAAAGYVGADPSEILVGCGADEVLDIVAKAFLSRGRRLRAADSDVCDVRRPQRAARWRAEVSASARARRQLRSGRGGHAGGHGRCVGRVAVRAQQPDRGA